MWPGRNFDPPARDLPPVGGRVNLLVLWRRGPRSLRVVAEVLRIERNPATRQAALQLLGSTPTNGAACLGRGLDPKMTEADDDYDDDDY